MFCDELKLIKMRGRITLHIVERPEAHVAVTERKTVLSIALINRPSISFGFALETHTHTCIKPTRTIYRSLD